jgi:SAM-dependent methyltransferase
MDERTAANRAMWDERVPIHLTSGFYDLDAFRAGGVHIRPFELAEVGDVSGKDLVHLQCHIGTDTLSWARLGARVVGLDFSPSAVAGARALAAECGLDAEFVVSDVYDAPNELGGRTFDVVYTGFGAINWLPDIARWAQVCASLVRPGGFLYLAEFHPFIDVFSWQELLVTRSYFHDPAGERDDSPGTYADFDAQTVSNEAWEWTHPMSDVVSAVLDAGLVLELLHEHDITYYRRFPFLEEREHGRFHMPEGMPSLPFVFSLRARRP